MDVDNNNNNTIFTFLDNTHLYVNKKIANMRNV